MRTLIIKVAAVLFSLLASVGCAIALSAGSAAASGTTTTSTTVTAPPIQGTTPRLITMYVDTVQGAGGSPAPAAGCAMTNLFEQGQVVVFRMWGTDGATLAPLTDKNVKSANVIIPIAGGGTVTEPLAYAAHGTVAYWTYGWATTTSTPLGVVNFKVKVTTKRVPAVRKKVKGHWKVIKKAIPSYTGIFTQAGFPSVSQLTITPDAA